MTSNTNEAQLIKGQKVRGGGDNKINKNHQQSCASANNAKVAHSGCDSFSVSSDVQSSVSSDGAQFNCISTVVSEDNVSHSFKSSLSQSQSQSQTESHSQHPPLNGLCQDGTRKRKKQKKITKNSGGCIGETKKSFKKVAETCANAKEKGKGSCMLVSNTENCKGKKDKKNNSATKATAANKKDNASTNAKSTSRKRKAPTKGTSTNKKKKEGLNDVDVETSKDATTPVDEMYEMHRKEFERVLTRLGKVDQYQFFWYPVPPEFDETYEDNNDQNDNNSIQSGQSHCTTHHVTFPSHPPFNWEMVNRRMQNNRYVLNREKEANIKRRRLLECLEESGIKTKDKVSLVAHPKGVDWDCFKEDVIGMCDKAVERNPDLGNRGSPGTVSFAAMKIKNELERSYEKFGRKQMMEMALDDELHYFSNAVEGEVDNQEPAMQGKWRKNAFPERIYEKLSRDVVCGGLSQVDEHIASYELKTSLPDSLVGSSYRYDDTGQSEDWMKSVLNETERKKNVHNKEERQAALALAADDGVVRAQVATSMNILLNAVQDRVMTENGVLHQPELRSIRRANWRPADDGIDGTGTVKLEKETSDDKKCNNEASVDCKPVCSKVNSSMPEVVETEVWGIDCYARRNITLCLTTEFDTDTALLFIEKWLLPAINACPVDLAHKLSNAARILEGLPFESAPMSDTDARSKPTFENGITTEKWKNSLLGKALLNKIKRSAPPWLKYAANLLRRGYDTLGEDFFRVHPKGHGSVVLAPMLEANTLVTFYRGEVYPSWRWGEKMDAIEITQQRKALKPALPDFYNMALERPQSDPRRYGLLFVDGSRKAGHGSSLSHSCQPTCEVRVCALNGELSLSMTTLRQVEMGEELTFDYNAVTESLNEYRSAICLCGYGKCRGSFLHFAMADCYQQVLNRNLPIATRFANLAKGCMKKVMSEDDEKVLQNHGFWTAVFGAISMNHRNASSLSDENNNIIKDSMDIVPVWLRTYVADTLRYIEYERRALPISLICDHLSTVEENSKVEDTKKKKNKAKTKKQAKKKNKKSFHDSKTGKLAANTIDGSMSEFSTTETDEESLKSTEDSRRESAFSFYLWKRRDFFHSLLLENGYPKTISGKELKNAIEKVASSHWNDLNEQEKSYWKIEAEEELQKEGSRKQKVRDKEGRKPTDQSANTKTDEAETEEAEDNVTSKISFHDADAEGVSAMEQRIQQLAQALSRVGRVLYRHREALLESESEKFSSTIEPKNLREVVESPLTVASDGHVVAWMWNHEDGIVRSLLAAVEVAECASPSLKQKVKMTEEKYGVLKKFGHPCSYSTKNGAMKLPMMPAQGRRKLTAALLEFRDVLLQELDIMSEDFKKHKRRLKKHEPKDWDYNTGQKTFKNGNSSSDLQSSDLRSVVSSALTDLVAEVDRRVSASTSGCLPLADSVASMTNHRSKAEFKLSTQEDDAMNGKSDEDGKALPLWLEHYNQRFKIQKAADLLLLYANTTTFFLMQPYKPLESTPLEVYARELGNAVPRSVIDTTLKQRVADGCVKKKTLQPTTDFSLMSEDFEDKDSKDNGILAATRSKSPRTPGICDPDEIVAKVTIKYQGDFVISQLLQWYNGGIGQKPGLPDIIGCILLPQISGCWKDHGEQSKKSDGHTFYERNIRKQLIRWLQDPHKRGSPWSKALQRSFTGNDTGEILIDTSSMWLPFGSPILDLLVMGDDSNIRNILEQLGDGLSMESNDALPKSVADTLLIATVDQGRPAQAISNWVQCENKECLKWRKIPWHVDIDVLSKHFICSHNIWNPSANSCDAPEDQWDETDNTVGEQGVEQVENNHREAVQFENRPTMTETVADQLSTLEEESFVVGARFDVRRSRKNVFCVGKVVDVDLNGKIKKAKFHFPKMLPKFDEWIEIGSERIAPLGSKTKSTQKTAVISVQLDKFIDGNRKFTKDRGSTDEEEGTPVNSLQHRRVPGAKVPGDRNRKPKKTKKLKNKAVGKRVAMGPESSDEQETKFTLESEKSSRKPVDANFPGRISRKSDPTRVQKILVKRKVMMDLESGGEEENAPGKPSRKHEVIAKEETCLPRISDLENVDLNPTDAKERQESTLKESENTHPSSKSDNGVDGIGPDKTDCYTDSCREMASFNGKIPRRKTSPRQKILQPTRPLDGSPTQSKNDLLPALNCADKISLEQDKVSGEQTRSNLSTLNPIPRKRRLDGDHTSCDSPSRSTLQCERPFPCDNRTEEFTQGNGESRRRGIFTRSSFRGGGSEDFVQNTLANARREEYVQSSPVKGRRENFSPSTPGSGRWEVTDTCPDRCRLREIEQDRPSLLRQSFAGSSPRGEPGFRSGVGGAVHRSPFGGISGGPSADFDDERFRAGGRRYEEGRPFGDRGHLCADDHWDRNRRDADTGCYDRVVDTQPNRYDISDVRGRGRHDSYGGSRGGVAVYGIPGGADKSLSRDGRGCHEPCVDFRDTYRSGANHHETSRGAGVHQYQGCSREGGSLRGGSLTEEYSGGSTGFDSPRGEISGSQGEIRGSPGVDRVSASRTGGPSSDIRGSPGELRSRSPDEIRRRSPGEIRIRSPGEIRGRSPGEIKNLSRSEAKVHSPGEIRCHSPAETSGRSPGEIKGSPGEARAHRDDFRAHSGRFKGPVEGNERPDFIDGRGRNGYYSDVGEGARCDPRNRDGGGGALDRYRDLDCCDALRYDTSREPGTDRSDTRGLGSDVGRNGTRDRGVTGEIRRKQDYNEYRPCKRPRVLDYGDYLDFEEVSDRSGRVGARYGREHNSGRYFDSQRVHDSAHGRGDCPGRGGAPLGIYDSGIGAEVRRYERGRGAEGGRYGSSRSAGGGRQMSGRSLERSYAVRDAEGGWHDAGRGSNGEFYDTDIGAAGGRYDDGIGAERGRQRNFRGRSNEYVIMDREIRVSTHAIVPSSGQGSKPCSPDNAGRSQEST